ncbi:hypothetical protein EDD22DRAFT_960115 [Suillus occidentalis]|nr:hypothetical protein EDD22DRAFT_960115 [Suillus occidentalis]
MVNPSSPVPFAFETSSYSHFLGNEQTETAMICWLQKQGRDTLPDSLFVTASVLFGWIDSHDLMALLDVSLREVATQLEKETDFCIISCCKGDVELELRNSPSCPKKLPTVVDIEHVKTYLLPSPVDFNDVPVQYLSLSPVNFDGVRPIQVMPDKCDARDKCNAWLLMLQSNALDVSGTSRVSFGSPPSEAVHLHEYLVGPNDRFLSLPRLLKTWVDNTTYRAYISASLAESKPSCNNDGFQTKERKSLVVLKSDIHILGLKKQRAQVEVDMLSEAIARMSEFEHTDDGLSSGSSMTCASRLPENSVGSFDDWLSTSYASSDI